MLKTVTDFLPILSSSSEEVPHYVESAPEGPFLASLLTLYICIKSLCPATFVPNAARFTQLKDSLNIELTEFDFVRIKNLSELLEARKHFDLSAAYKIRC